MPDAQATETRRSPGWLPWALVAAVGPFVLLVIRVLVVDDARWWFVARLLYWTMPVVVAAAIAAGVWRWRARSRGEPAANERTRWLGALTAIVATAVVFTLVPPAMRVQFDETSLVNTSNTMHEKRAAMMVTSAVPFDGSLTAIENTIDKRPPLFSFFVSVLHDVGGERIANAFAVNAALLAIALFLAFEFVRPRLGLAAAFAAQLLLLAVPLTTIVATSAGFDLLATVLLGGVLLAARDFVQRPDGPRGAWFLALGLVFVQARYESLLAFAVLAMLVIWRVRGRWRPGTAEKALLAALPTAITPLLFLLEIARNPNFYPEAGGAPLVAWSHGVAHTGPLLAAWFAPQLANPLPGVVAIGAAIAWLVALTKRTVRGADAVLLLPVAAVTVVALFWFFGDVRDLLALRLYLPFAFLTALSPLLFVATFGRRLAPWLLGIAALLATLRIDAVRRGEAFPKLDAQLMLEAVETAITQSGLDAPSTLWVTTVAQHLVTTRRAAMAPLAFQNHADDVRELLARSAIRAICVIETSRDGDLAGGFGDPRSLLARGNAATIVRVDGPMPVTVHRLR